MHAPSVSRLIVALVLAFSLLSSVGIVNTALAQPTLTYASPSAVRPGEETEVLLVGTKLDGTPRIWTSFPGSIEVLEQAADGARLKCKVTLPPETPLGLGGILLANEQGLTDTLWLMVDDLPSIAEANDNRGPETAQPLTLPVAVDGVANGPEPDYFRLDATAGDVLSFEVYAARMGSTCDPVVRVLDAEGRELGMADDDVARGADCRLTLTMPVTGSYLVELRDSRYASGGRYRLRIGDFPSADVALPSGVRQGTVTEVRFPSEDHPGATRLVKSQPLPLGVQAVSVKREGGVTATPVPIVVSDLPEYVASQPNHSADEATRVSIPAGFSGTLPEGKRGYFEFLAAAGDRFVFQSYARSIGSPAYPLLRLWDAEGKQLAESPVGESDEVTLAFAFPADGLYRLSVEDLLRGGSPQHAYRVEAQRVPFTLSYKVPKDVPYKATLNSGIGAWVVDVTCQRHGYDGPITVRMDPPSPHFEWIQSTIPEKATEAKLVLAARESASPGIIAAMRIVGEATVNGVPHLATVSSLANVRAKWPMIISPPAWQRDLLALSTGPAPAPFFEVSTETARVFYPRGIGTGDARLTSVRLDAEFKDALAPVITRGPGGVVADVKTEGDVHDVSLRGPVDLPAGTYPVEFTFWGSLKGRSIVQRTHLLLDVQDPVALALPSMEPLQAGESHKLTIGVERLGGERHPVTIRFPELPAGITVAEATVPADQDQVEVELAVAADAMPGRLGRLTVEATSHYQEQEVGSRGSIVLEVKAAAEAESSQ